MILQVFIHLCIRPHHFPIIQPYERVVPLRTILIVGECRPITSLVGLPGFFIVRSLYTFLQNLQVLLLLVNVLFHRLHLLL